MFQKVKDVVVVVSFVYACKGLLDFGIDLLHESKKLLRSEA